MEDTEFIARDYQNTLLTRALDENSIIYLPTGSGKTYIALMLIKQLSNDLEIPLSEGGKRSVFLVNTVPLVAQQAKHIRSSTHIDNVGEYTGDKNVDDWSEEAWTVEIHKNQVLVMTCQIFLHLISHRYIMFEMVNVLIFDECHHATKEHPMHQIMVMYSNETGNKPRILGLTATLLNSNCKPDKVASEVRALESTLQSKVATVDEMEAVLCYSTNPSEVRVYYQNSTDMCINVIEQRLNNLMEVIADQITDTVEAPAAVKYNMTNMKRNASVTFVSLAKNTITDCIYHLKDMGLMGGFVCLLCHTLDMECQSRRTSNKCIDQLCQFIITEFILCKRLLKVAMQTSRISHIVLDHSTPKLKQLLYALNRYSKNGTIDIKGIIFVQRRFTAKVLFHILKLLAKTNKDFKYLRPQFMVGLAARPMTQTLEGELEAKWSKKALIEFRNGRANILVATNVLEEGIDIPQCSLVIRYDEILHYCTYIQSKGRARDTKSVFVAMVADDELPKFSTRMKTYSDVEKILQELLVGQTDNRAAPSSHEISNELMESIHEPYYTAKGACVTSTSAISLVNRYCSVLPQDKFTKLSVNYFITKRNNEEDPTQYKVCLEMPIMSPVRDLIEGDWMLNKKDAKRSAAYKAVIRLHQEKQLDDNLMPLTVSEDTNSILPANFFNHWLSEEPTMDETGQRNPKPGTKKRLRQHAKVNPEHLLNACPVVKSTTYLHLIKMSPAYERPSELNNRLLTFYDMLSSTRTYCILTSKRLPELCPFILHLSVGEISTEIQTNYSIVTLSESEITALRLYQMTLFKDILGVLQHFLLCDSMNEGTSFFIAPVISESIDWEIVRQFSSMKKPSRPSLDERILFKVDAEDYRHAVVFPWYRNLNIKVGYVVTRVCEEMSPDTPFPTEFFTTYDDYFHEKYQLQAQCSEQPLLEVKPISFQRLNCLRSRASRFTKKKYANDFDGAFDEHLIPEYCFKIDYPAVLYLKAALIPSTLHRLVGLLNSYELAQRINRDPDFYSNLPDEFVCEPLEPDAYAVDIEEKLPASKSSQRDNDGGDKLNSVEYMLDLSNGLNDQCEESVRPVTLSDIDCYDIAVQTVDAEHQWDLQDEPTDFHRNIDNIYLMEIDYFEKFIAKKVSSSIVKHFNQLSICEAPPLDVCDIQLLKDKAGCTMHLQEMLTVLTAKSANDIINLERLESLGDSFLKFAITLYLMYEFPNFNEGQITAIKGKIIGNRNLFYCGLSKGLGGIINLNEFAPSADWTPPGFYLPKLVQELFLSGNVSYEFLYRLEFTEDELITGKLKDYRYDEIKVMLDNGVPNSVPSTLVQFLGMQEVSDKTVADCVEALIGQYLKTYGVSAAMSLLGWLRVVPPSHTKVTNILKQVPMPAKLRPHILNSEIDYHLKGRCDIENKLGYKFRDRSYLLQALTHASYTVNRLTDCYQRLELLGDSILDFLITSHIYESCGELTPGQLTDLRSALVNNVTFAGFTVRNGFYRHILAFNSSLNESMNRFVQRQIDCNHEITSDVLVLMQEDECQFAEYVDVPKVLGDLFESIAAAVFLDCGMNLQVVWRVFYKLMHKEIKMFSTNVPKQAVRLLYEAEVGAKFGKAFPIDYKNAVMVPLEFTHNAQLKTVYGIGQSKVQAIRAAAKLALRTIKTTKK